MPGRDAGFLGRRLPWFRSRASGRPARRVTSCVCSAWPALCATMRACSGRPTSARSPIRSSALWRPNSSRKAQRAVQDACRRQARWRSPASRRESGPCRCSPAKSFTKPNVRAGASSRLNDSRFTVNLHFLRAHSRMVVVHEAVHAEFVGRIDADAAVAVGKFERLQDAE